jgi:purine-binding chemotaxis protein CheW
METLHEGLAVHSGPVHQYATFYVGDALLGLRIEQVEEINRHVSVTPVPHAPDYVSGVVNLRGEVVTVVDPRVILGLGATDVTSCTRNVIVNHEGEHVGLLVDRVGDVVSAADGDITPPPSNVQGSDGRFFSGIYKLDDTLMVVLDVSELLSGNRTAT